MSSPTNGRLITPQTGISIGMMVILITGIWAILNSINSAKSDASNARQELNVRLDKLEARISIIESQKNSWTAVQMFQWAVHLQQLNSDGKKLTTDGLKVPEPEIVK